MRRKASPSHFSDAMNREDAIRKIRALLNAKGRTAAEAETAQIIAASLAEKHKIDLEEAASERPEAAPILHKEVGEWSAIPPEAKYAASVCQCFFDVSKLTVTGYSSRIVLIGTAHHLEIATYIYTFLKREFSRMWTQRRGRSRKRTVFIYGCYLAVKKNLEQRLESAPQPESANALAISLSGRRDKYIADTFGQTVSMSIAPKDMKGTALSKGWRAGLAIQIRPGVGAAPGAAGALPPARLALPAST